VRSSVAPFVWVTCPAILRKLKRDGKILGITYDWEIPDVPEDRYLGLKGDGKAVIFEDLMLEGSGPITDPILTGIQSLTPVEDTYGTAQLADYLCLVSDSSFSMLIETGTEVQARIVLNNETKTSKNLWYQELVPANTVFYTLISMSDQRVSGERKPAEDLMQSVKDTVKGFIQIGGDETLGRGWTRLVWQEVK
jgi:CRISPR-associated protein Cmr4